MKTKHICTFLIFIAFAIQTNAQILYNYDNNGNRTSSGIMHYGDIKPQKKDTTKKDSIPAVTVYPNPTTGEINVAISSFNNCGHATIYVLDASERLIATQEATSTVTQINLSGYNQGTYYLRTIMCDNQYSCKIIKTTPGPGTPPKVVGPSKF